MAGEGDVLLFEPAFSASGGAVRCDILERRQGQWTLTEVKGAGGAKDHHLLDLAFQTWVLRAAGVHVERSILQLVDTSYVHPGGDDYTGIFKSVDLTREVAELLPKLPEMLGVCDGVLRGPEPAMRVGAHCDMPWPCAFYDHCAQGEPEYPVSLLKIRRKAFLAASEEGGWLDVRDVPEADVGEGRPLQIWMGTVSSTPVVNPDAARALASHPYPRYFLDFETYGPAIPRWKGTRPYQAIPFQWSCHVQGRAGDVEHREFLDVTGADPVRPAAEALIDALGDSGPIFEYTDYEGRTIEGMIRSCPDLEAPLRAIRERLVDLHPVTKSAYYHRDMRGSWSLKAVLPTIAPDLDYANLGEIQDGGAAAEAYEVLADPATDPARRAALDRDLRAYCRRDTEGLMRLAGFLEGLR